MDTPDPQLHACHVLCFLLCFAMCWLVSLRVSLVCLSVRLGAFPLDICPNPNPEHVRLRCCPFANFL